MTLPIISRAQAKAEGRARYFTGLPCKHGHVAERYVSGTCVECMSVAYQTDPEGRKAVSKAARAANIGAYYDKAKAYAKKNAEKIAQYQAEYRMQNRAAAVEYYSTWRAENRHIRAALNAKREAQKDRRTPSWLTDQDQFRMKLKYAEARWMTAKTGILHHVDHYYPLQGKLVSGLHVPGNLRVIPARENIKKNAALPLVDRYPI